MPNSAATPSEIRAMRRFALFVICFTAIVILGATLPHGRLNAHAAANPKPSANWRSGGCEDEGGHWSHWGESHLCQMRRTTLALYDGHLSVDTMNGAISLIGEDRPDVALEARVQAWAPSQAAVSDLMNQIVIDAAHGAIHDHGPHPSFFERAGYSIDYDLRVPRHLAADLHTMNGSIDLTRLDGALRFQTTNGAVHLDQLAGDVQGDTVNGRVDISLAGNRWQGAGLRANTTNGRVDIRIPDPYSAHLETGTVNGGIEINFPITVQGEIRSHLNTNLGSGGPTIHAQTVNGRVSISHSSSATED